jgi:hypothetical protein
MSRSFVDKARVKLDDISCVKTQFIYRRPSVHPFIHPSDNFKRYKTKRYPKISILKLEKLVKTSEFVIFRFYFKIIIRLKAMLHGAIFLATCNAILLLRDVN